MIDNGHIYKPANGSLSIGEVAEFFGVQKRSDNRYHLSDVCKAALIVCWSRIKPVVWNQWVPDRTRSDWWKTANHMCGFRLTRTGQQSQRDVFTELSSIAAEFVAGRNHPWVYERPSGGAQSPYRLLDFDGYAHDAQSPCGSVYTSQPLDVNSSGGTRIPISFPDNDDGNSLTIDDFDFVFTIDDSPFSVKTSYPGVMLVYGNRWVASTFNTQMQYLTLESWNDIGFSNANHVLSLNPITNVSAFMFFSSVSFSNASNTDEDDIEGVFMSAFGAPIFTVSLHREGSVAITTFCPAYSDDDLVWRNAYVTCPMAVGVVSGTTATLHNATINIVLLSDATDYNNGTIDLTTFRSRYFQNSTLPMTLTLNPSTIVDMRIYASTEDGFDPTKAYVCVLEADELTAPVLDWTVVDTNPS